MQPRANIIINGKKFKNAMNNKSKPQNKWTRVLKRKKD